jgi:hypothetical protein
MVAFNFEKEFRHWALRARKHCVLCKAMSLLVYKPGVVEIDAETARAAAQAGAGSPVENSGGGSRP